jgi:nucleotide-binding universal stress UspA family protein
VGLGVPHLEIVRAAEERHADLVVMATHGRGFFSHAFLGSTTERVIRRAPCPVLVVHATTKH